MNKCTITTDLPQKEVFEILLKLEHNTDISTYFIENNNKHYVVSIASVENQTSIFIALNPNQSKIKQQKFDFADVCNWLFEEKKMKIGRNNLFKLLREYQILNHDNSPAKNIDKKYLFSENITTFDNGKQNSYPVTFATEEGLDFIYNILIDKSIKN